MTYLLLGEAATEREKRISEIREKALPSSDSRTFDYEVLYAAKLQPQILKERLIAFPTLAKQRVLVIHQCEELSSENRDLLTEFLSGPTDHVVLILTSDTMTPQHAFAQKIKPFAKITDFGQKPELNVFEMTKALDRRQAPEALQILGDLFASGQHPLQIMGGLVWFWRQKKNRLSAIKFEAGLDALQDADVNIKRSRLAPEHAVEMLVVKLGEILG